jgi:hypothetical protein
VSHRTNNSASFLVQLCPFMSILVHFGPFLVHFGPFWSILVHFGPFLAILCDTEFLHKFEIKETTPLTLSRFFFSPGGF